MTNDSEWVSLSALWKRQDKIDPDVILHGVERQIDAAKCFQRLTLIGATLCLIIIAVFEVLRIIPTMGLGTLILSVNFAGSYWAFKSHRQTWHRAITKPPAEMLRVVFDHTCRMLFHARMLYILPVPSVFCGMLLSRVRNANDPAPIIDQGTVFVLILFAFGILLAFVAIGIVFARHFRRKRDELIDIRRGLGDD